MLTLVVTRQCSAACDHCCFDSSPRAKERIPRERITSLIREAKEIPSISLVSFVGGEAFLLGRELDEHIETASRLGLTVSITTNGYWATALDVAHARLSAAYAAGLRVISFSTGQMHAQFVPVERVVSGARAAAEIGLETTISIERFDGSRFDAMTVRTPEIEAFERDGRLRIFEREWIPSASGKGRATLPFNPERSRFSGSMDGCGIVLDDLTVLPDSTLAACCGYPVEHIPDLHFGSVAQRTLSEAITGGLEDWLKLALAVIGPERLYAFAKRQDPGIRLPVESMSICHTCLALHRDERAMEVLRRHADTFADDIRAAYENSRPIPASPLFPQHPPLGRGIVAPT